MNKLTKIGVSALCGSLAAVSAAQAGEVVVTGGADMTYLTQNGATVGNPLGMNSGLVFKGTGELDNGTTFTLTISGADKDTYSASAITLVTPGMGTIGFDQGAGGQGIDRLDDKMPTAWEETDGTGIGAGLVTVSGIGGSQNIEWAAPSDLMPDGLSLHIGYSPKVGQSKINDKTFGGDGPVTGAGYDIVIEHTALIEGASIFAGYSSVEQPSSGPTNSDQKEYAAGATYAAGPITVGYQYTRSNREGITNAVTSYYENEAWGVSFNVNDDLAISYGHHQSSRNITSAANVDLDATSIQLSYSMGGATLKFADTSVDNANYSTAAADDKDGTSIMLSLAF